MEILIQQEGENHHHHEHQAHSFEEEERSSHDHIIHNNHCDEGLYDLVICYLSELEHSTDVCNLEHCLPSSQTSFSKKDLSRLELITTLFSVVGLTFHIEESKNYYSSNSSVRFSQPTLEQPPHRGPPLLFS